MKGSKKRLFGILLSLALVLSLMPGMSMTVKADDVMEWSNTGTLPTEAKNYKLTADVRISNTWTAPQGTTILDLNGHNITKTGSYGSVIIVNSDSTLTLKGSGIVSGGHGSSKSPIDSDKFNSWFYPVGGGVLVNGGDFTLDGSTISGNTSRWESGGVWLVRMAHLPWKTGLSQAMKRRKVTTRTLMLAGAESA